MYTETAKYYDLIYSKFKDYNKEADKIVALLKDKCPAGKTILDVACGTGEHSMLLTEKTDLIIDGLDIMPEFIKVAKSKNISGEIHQGDMINFVLNKKYDIVMCLFSSIGYVKTLDNVTKTLICFKNHINDNGIILVEPWFTPDVAKHGHFDCTVSDNEKIKICRMARTEIDERIHRIHFQYLVNTPDDIRHLKETHELGIFTQDEMLACFEKAGLNVEFDNEGLFGRGMYIATLK